MHRFFLPPGAFQQNQVRFPADTARQLRTVLRLRPGQQVIALDNAGSEYTVTLAEVETQSAWGEIDARRPALGEPAARLALYLGLTQREKFEWMLQKCTEIGAAAFIPFISSRSLVQNKRESEGKQERWQRILQEAAEQSGRGLIPTLHPPLDFTAALDHARQNDRPALIAWEGEDRRSLRAALQELGSPPQLSLLIGPEGGFSAAEVEQARAAGLQAVTLGRRILRMETAAVAAAALVLYQLGEMD